MIMDFDLDWVRTAPLSVYANGQLQGLNVPCFNCGDPAFFDHHVVPRVLGGKKTVPLCAKCHGKIHDLNLLHTSELIRAGLARAKSNGKKLGRPNGSKIDVDEAKKLRNSGLSIRKIAKKMNIGQGSVQRALIVSDPPMYYI
jgi:hypothetical protein